MNVVFFSPSYPLEMQDYTRGLAEVGANVIGAAEGPASMLPSKVKRYLSDYIQVPKLFDERGLTSAILKYGKKHRIDRVESLWEPLTLAAASIREQLGIPGMSRETVLGFRDKSIMKDRIAKAGLRVPYAFRCKSSREIEGAAEKIGFPIIIKGKKLFRIS